MNAFARKSFKFLMIIFLIYAVLISTHKGEFWPFSIYPMFSQAGKPWTRAMVQDVSQAPQNILWKTTDLNHLHGPAVPLEKTGIEQIDFANFISKTKKWDSPRRQALTKMFRRNQKEPFHWLITKVHGYLTPDDSVIVSAQPLFLITPNKFITNPDLSASEQ